MPEPVGLGHWRAGAEAAQILVGNKKSWTRPPESAAAKKTSKTGLASLKPAGFLKIFFFKVIIFPFFNWVICLSGVQSCEYFIYFGDQTLV